ncbi:MAG TPA: hypothetical protein VIO36_16840 [Anaerolineaceae bacterium]
MNTILRNKKQIIILVVLLVVAFLMMDLNNRLTELFRLSQQRDAQATEVTLLEQTRVAQETEMAYAQSADAVEIWAYGEGKKIRPGDHVINPIADPNYTAPVPTEIVVTPEKVENWQVWKALFLGDDS